MDIIHLLPDSVANQIAAGEVIQRPASCLKELVENSLDAGADDIQIILQDSGRTLLQVIDNGKGMSQTDARMAFERHATSKIRQAADLFNLHTMGFRGEALASIAAVAQVELLTRQKDSELGTYLEIAGSQVQKQEFVACAEGTNFKVKNLFFNVPARRRFLKTNATELRNLLNDFFRIALVYPAVHFTFVNDDEILYDLPQQSYKQRIDAIFGKQQRKSFASQLVEISTDTQLVKIYGYVGKPEEASKNAQQYFFVNGRYMKHPYFHKAVMSAYSGLLTQDQQPHYFIYFDIQPDAIDINIHPTKTEIKFADEQSIWQILLAAVREALGKFNLIPSMDFQRDETLNIASVPSSAPVAPPKTNYNPQYNPFASQNTYYQPRTSVSDWQKLYQTEPAQPTEQTKDIQSETLFELNISDITPIQYKDKYILVPTETGIVLIHQHRAHSAVLYAHFLEQQKKKQGTMQQVLFPEILDLSADDTQVLLQAADELRSVGFDINQISRNSFSIDGVPAELGTANPLQTLLNILHTLSEQPQNMQEQWAQTIASLLADDAAIPQGRHLTEEEMRDLIARLWTLPQKRYTQQGKKIITFLTTEDIDKMFI